MDTLRILEVDHQEGVRGEQTLGGNGDRDWLFETGDHRTCALEHYLRVVDEEVPRRVGARDRDRLVASRVTDETLDEHLEAVHAALPASVHDTP